MTDPAIRAALDAAWQAECAARDRVNECDPMPCTSACPWCAAGSAAAIAAFLRALPKSLQGEFLKSLAAVVEEAARHEQM